jgi:hypothetical protein
MNRWKWILGIALVGLGFWVGFGLFGLTTPKQMETFIITSKVVGIQTDENKTYQSIFLEDRTRLELKPTDEITIGDLYTFVAERHKGNYFSVLEVISYSLAKD